MTDNATQFAFESAYHGTDGYHDPHEDLASAGLRQAGDAIIVIDRQGIIREWNSKCAELFGYTAEEALGHDVKLLIPERLRDAHDEAFHKAMEQGHLSSDGHPRRTKAITASGEPVYVVMTFAVINEDGTHATPALGSVAVARRHVRGEAV